MSEKRFSWKTEKLQHLDDEVIMVVDNENNDWKGHILNIVDLLNDLSDENNILNKNEDDLKECTIENIKLKKEIAELQEDITDYHTALFDLHKKYDKLEKENVKLRKQIDEQQTTINTLKEEKDKLRELIKENVFGRYREGSLADLEFKAIAYDDIVKLEIFNESEPKVIVSCRQGRKENVKSFCQMFIPFGWYYEIKETNE